MIIKRKFFEKIVRKLSSVTICSVTYLRFAIISKVLSKIEAKIATGVLTVPLFKTQSWFTWLLWLLIHELLLIPKSNSFLYFPYKRKTMPIQEYRKQWLQFCYQRICDPIYPTLVIVLEFLHVLPKRNFGVKLYNSFLTHPFNEVNTQILSIRLLVGCRRLSQANSSFICLFLESILIFTLQVSLS